jgi:predicted dehydrogenase
MNHLPNCDPEMSPPAMRFGLVGAGNIARTYLQAFERCAEACVVAVADARLESAQAAAQGLGCRAYSSHVAMAEDCELDAVLVCTPPGTHPDICAYFLKRRVHVLCEKPLSVDVGSAVRMLDLARQNHVRLTMASKFRYVEDVIKARSIVTSGILGEIILFENVFASHVDMAARWNSVPEISGGGVLIDNGTHSVDITRYFLGPLAEVDVVEGKRSQRLPVEETVRVFVRSLGGVVGNIDLSWSINKERDSYIDIYGSRGTISIGWKESKYRQSSSRDWVVFGKGYNKLQAFRSQIENFTRAIRGEEMLLITPEDALASVMVVSAAYQALHNHHWTDVCYNLPEFGAPPQPLISQEVEAA